MLSSHNTVPSGMSTSASLEDIEYNRQNARVSCPCQNFAALSKIVEVLSSEFRTSSMIDWLNGETDGVALSKQALLSCGKRCQCRYRYGTSFAILNAIQDACAPFLQDPNDSANNSGSSTTPFKRKTQHTEPVISYDAAFPPLDAPKPHPAASNILVPPNNTSFKDIVSTQENGVSGSSLRSQKKKSKVRAQLREAATQAEASTNSWQTQLDIEKITTNMSSSLSQKEDDEIRNIHSHSVTASSAIDKPQVQTAESLEELPLTYLDRLVKIYIALFRNMLIPSTPAQLNLLLQMLLILPTQDIRQSKTRKDGTILFFRPFFSTPTRCVQFAQESLAQLHEIMVLRRLSPHLIQSLAQSDVFQRLCPIIVDELTQHLETIGAERELPPWDSKLPHAIFSLPFEHDRDSRHNYKTSFEVALYKNREDSRDAFLSQLRTFMTAKARAFHSQDVDKVRAMAQQEAQRIIGKVFNVNMIWFSQFFCDLLVQIGVSPVEEMDQDLLSFVQHDKERLQKLHMRMYGNANQFGNTRSLSVGRSDTEFNFGVPRNTYKDRDKGIASSSAPFMETLLEFPGYQEFFFLFLHAVDSYKFGMQLSQQLARKIQVAISNRSPVGLEKRMMELQLLGRFLGYLIFSSNWHHELVDWTKLKPLAICSDQGLNQLESVGLNLQRLIRNAFFEGYTLLVVPCVTELLKMCKWDSLTQMSRSYRQLLADLRFIQKTVSLASSWNMNLQIISFHLETLFHETFTLPKLTSLPPATITGKDLQWDALSLDSQKFIFGSTIIFASSSSMEPLCEMILVGMKTKSKAVERQNVSRVRKLRPSVVSTAPGTKMQSDLRVESPVRETLSTPSTHQSENPGDDRQGIQNRLEDAFFHQHRNLKEICDFAIDQTLKALSSNELKIHVDQHLVEKIGSVGLSDNDDEIINQKGIHLLKEWLQTLLETKLRKTLQALVPPGVNHEVIDVAVKLSLSRGMKSCDELLHSIVSDLRKGHQNTESQSNRKDTTPLLHDEWVVNATQSLTHLRQSFSVGSPAKNLELVIEASRLVEMVAESALIPSNDLLRDFFVSVIGLQSVAELARKEAIQHRSEESWETFLSFLLLVSLLSRVSVFGTKRIMDLLSYDFDAFLLECKEAPRDDRLELLRRSVTGNRLNLSRDTL
jgi:hypothetical protein